MRNYNEKATLRSENDSKLNKFFLLLLLFFLLKSSEEIGNIRK